uniref:NADH dehydrogenase subunit 5 n=1 Tax=Enoplolambrus validus TaxID=2969665 RepID=UPI0023F21D01|nr:NADH dehydrogenase subunit 5 [Enoplolambrus validus]WDV10168.1 NADH dehydrogenase subunit 5 [Enoplolambrus validus]
MSMNEVSMVYLLFVSFYCGVNGLMKLKMGMVDIVEWELISISSSTIVFTFVFDWVSLLFMCFVFLISSSVMFYSGSYMLNDKSLNRFMYIVLAFVLSMSLMVFSPNLISILLGWDGLGLVSYALVIYYQNEKSVNAGMLTVLSNRVGDVAILLGIYFMSTFGSWNFFLYSSYMNDNMIVLKLFIMLAAMTKSAQIPFSAWLPAAMAAPTPVSALVHSSTLVTAGVYLMIRFSSALEDSKVQSMLLFISCLTMFMAGLGANFEYDLKKIIALSTLSQLGVMLSILSLGYMNLSFLHLLSHALFKALLFMCAGVIIHGMMDFQDIRYMGGLIKYMPFTLSLMMISNLALCGFPFLAGFYSKDMILEVAFMSNINFMAFLMYVLATGLTVMYTLRLMYYAFMGEYNFISLSNIIDEDYIMSNSMIVLGSGSILAGSVLSWLLFPEPYMICMNNFMKFLILLVSFLGGIVGYSLNILSTTYKLNGLGFYSLTVMMGSMWFMPMLSSFKNSNFFLNLGMMIQNKSDKGWYEYLGAQGLNYLISMLFMKLNFLQMNSVKVFMKMFFLMGFFLLFIYL